MNLPSVRDRFRAFPLDDALLFFQPSTGTSVRVQNERTEGLRRRAPRVAMFGITNRCNLTCDFCSRDTSRERAWTVESAALVLQGLSSGGTLEVAFGGGEPFAFRGFPARGPEGPRSRGQAPLTEGDVSAEPALVLLIRTAKWHGRFSRRGTADPIR